MQRILIANRGEIACRVARSAHALGYETVAVFSEPDRGARHARACDQAVALGGATAAESYLDVAKILAAAARTGADAVHPGYGFLAENAGFAEACAQAGLTFIGPPPEAIRLMGSKRQAKLRMEAAGVPCVPGYSGGEQRLDALRAEAERVGFPLMVKASAGGGGRGLRVVRDPAALETALGAARREAESAFGDGELILERAVDNPRHVEIQVFADTHGHVVHLGERDCSVQRRHQKVVEEAPSPAVDAGLRAQMGAAAVAAARAIGYVGAGTVEMLLDPDGRYYFMEMNTRLQVEHPVTELVTGQDLVAWQLDVAAGRPLPMTQDELRLDGHAIEVRLYAEDPYADFVPQTGAVSALRWPPGVRVDHGLDAGQAVTAFYDAMVAKLVAHGRDRDEARRRLLRALSELRVFGLVTNQAYLAEILAHPAFAAGEATTAFIGEHLAEATRPAPEPRAWAAAAALLAGGGGTGWRSSGPAAVPVRLTCGEDTRVVWVTRDGEAVRTDVAAEGEATVALERFGVEGGAVTFEDDGLRLSFDIDLSPAGDAVEIAHGAALHRFTRRPHTDAAAQDSAAGAVVAPMAGRVVEVRAAPGHAVTKGDILVVLEAMKMQLELTAPRDGTIAEVRTEVAAQVDNKQTLVTLETDA